MAKKKKKKALPSIEIIIVLVFFFSFIVWAVSKCDAKKTMYELQAAEEEAATNENIAESENTAIFPADRTDRPTSEYSRQNNTTTNNNAQAPTIRTETVYATKLYVNIQDLKLRTGPSLDSTVLLTLPLHYELEFMNEVTDSTQQISLGEGTIAEEPWIKVRHHKGHIGWVYGAGVHYYKQ